MRSPVESGLDALLNPLGTKTEGGQEASNILDQASLGHEQEGRRQDGLDNLARDALVEASNTFILDNLTEPIHNGRVALLGIVGLLQLHARLDNTIQKQRTHDLVSKKKKKKRL